MSHGPCALALDIGTSTLKALLVDSRGCVRGEARRPTPLLVPRGVSPLARQMHPPTVLKAVQAVAQEVLAHSPGAHVAVVALTSMRQGVALLDNEGKEIYLGPNIDLRAVFEGGALDEAYGEMMYSTTGHLPSLFFPWSRLVWLREHRPQAYRRATVVLPLADWLAYRLTGVVGAEMSLAGEAGLLDIRERQWATGLTRTLGLRDDWFPPLFQASTVRGQLTREGSALVGVPEGTPVVVAGPDTQCALRAAGVQSAGQGGVVLGWSTAVQLLTATPRFDKQRRTWVGLFPDSAFWTAEANAGDGGRALQWTVDTLYGRGARAWGRLERDVEAVEPGSGGVMALLGPTALDLSHPGVRLGGWLLPVPLSFSPVGRGHLARAVIENIVFAVRACLELLEEVSGERVGAVHLAGGLLRLPVLAPLMAQVLGREVYGAPHPSASALGAGLAGLHSIGALERKPPCAVHRPRDHLVAAYHDCYQAWRRAERGLGGMGWR
ncbi:MAG: FGGY-family carbohydrate kinase [Dehalococcoidia bacterium]|nr:FGGY-family carbohydrate kinase [Dehalococcoidia bacterium]MDW8120475.1 FGGY-family carbohydrate kinase [Chloroflexota bacterium]